MQSLRIMRSFERSVGHYLLSDFKVESPFPMFLQVDGEAVLLGDNLRYQFELLPDAVMVLSKHAGAEPGGPASA